MKWFKFYGQDYLSDPKILALTACERSCLITLLSYGSVNDNGVITFLNEEQLMAQSGISPIHEEWEHTQGVLEKLKKLKIIEIDNDMITIINWKKRQETSLTSYERVKRHREKKRNDNAMITPEENRIEENRRKDCGLKETASLSKTRVKVKNINNFRDERREEVGNPPMTPREQTKKQKATIDAFKTGIDYFKKVGYDQHGMLFMEVKSDKRNAIVRKLIKAAYDSIGDLNGLIDWWFGGIGEWADYEPEQCFSLKTIEKFKNKNKSKTKGWWE